MVFRLELKLSDANNEIDKKKSQENEIAIETDIKTHNKELQNELTLSV